MNLKRPSEFKANQRYDWRSEALEERGSSFFFDDSTHASVDARNPTAPTHGVSSLSVAIVVAVMLGAVGLVAMARLLQD
jgi:hypothetical protein